MEPIRAAVRLPHSWCIADVDAIVEVAELADELDMDVSVQDHLLADSTVSPCGHVHDGEDRAVFEAHTTMSYVAARTQRSRLIAGIYVLPYRHPVWLVIIVERPRGPKRPTSMKETLMSCLPVIVPTAPIIPGRS